MRGHWDAFLMRVVHRTRFGELESMKGATKAVVIAMDAPVGKEGGMGLQGENWSGALGR